MIYWVSYQVSPPGGAVKCSPEPLGLSQWNVGRDDQWQAPLGGDPYFWELGWTSGQSRITYCWESTKHLFQLRKTETPGIKWRQQKIEELFLNAAACWDLTMCQRKWLPPPPPNPGPVATKQCLYFWGPQETSTPLCVWGASVHPAKAKQRHWANSSVWPTIQLPSLWLKSWDFHKGCLTGFFSPLLT